jgi:hypothetical protein
VRMMATSKWVGIAMRMIWRTKKVMNVEVQHAHEATSRPLIVKRIDAKIIIIEMMTKTWFVSSRTPGVKTSTPNHLVISMTTLAHGLARPQQAEQVAIPERQGLKALTTTMKPSHLCRELTSCSNA